MASSSVLVKASSQLGLEAAPHGMRTRLRASASRLQLLSLPFDLLSRITSHVPDADLLLCRLSCAPLRDAARKPERKARTDFLRAPALARWALANLPDFRAGVSEERLCALAARAGSLETLRWLRVIRNCAWDADTCYEAACAGHFEVLRWAHAHGCAWPTNDCHERCVCFAAARCGFLPILRFARAHGAEWCRYACEDVALQQGHVHVAHWIQHHSVPPPRVMVRAT
jgi:hypothetical protein